MKSLQDPFDVALQDALDRSKAKGFRGAIVRNWFASYGGEETAHRVLQNPENPWVLRKLAQMGLLDTSVEALALDSRFRKRFSPEELEEARRRLDAFEYFDTKRKKSRRP